ncbi:hypothetical protein [Leptolyngbya sp. KIOST-1]|uniref:hypothetical protein n=1 Tax=Leptolyngbya sp. KIOST-1 TaxID=1229172 RepID=UPI001CEC13A3|nr:hypothetical protein [Leptolyngbya sp. KIOST-1]
MILWRRTLGVGLGLVAAGSLCTVAQASSVLAEVIDDAPGLVQVDELPVEQAQAEAGLVDQAQLDQTSIEQAVESLDTPEAVAEALPLSAEDLADLVTVADPATEVALVPTQVLENLSQEQIEAIATIIATAEETPRTEVIANLPAEVLTHLDTLVGVQPQVSRRRWLPTNLVRRLRIPQMVAALIRQPKNSALVMLGNHIVVVNPVTGAVLGAVLGAL